jgi:hypothetical protein
LLRRTVCDSPADQTDDEFERIKSMIEDSGANLGALMLKHWIAEHKNQLPPACYFGIGVAFAFAIHAAK